VSIFSIREFETRLQSLQQELSKRGIDWGILNNNADLYYYCGSMQPLYLMVPAQGEAVVVARKALSRIMKEVEQLNIEVFSSGKEFTSILEKYGIASSAKVGLTFDVLSHSNALRLRKGLPQSKIEDISMLIRFLRMVKSPAELKIQRRAANIMSNMPELIREFFKPGMNEIELSMVLENYFRRHGHCLFLRCRREGVEIAGYGICSAGINSLVGTKFEGICSGLGVSAASPHGASPMPIPENTPVILDYAFNLEGYHVDQTRMFCWGTPSAEYSGAYQAMVEIEEALASEIHPGLPWGKLYESASAMALGAGYAESFMGCGQEKVRFVGHGVGVELDEMPYLAEGMEEPLEAGMVIALEPKVALSGTGVVGIEDTYLVKENGVEQLTQCAKEIIVCPQ
jgi:Xaa-Pro dipeptidase